MPEMTFAQVSELAIRWGTAFAWAAVLLGVGWTLAGWAERAALAAVRRLKADAMLAGFFASLARWAVLVFTGLAVLDRLGVETTSVVAVVGAAGLAVGLALQGTLSNLAAGVMLLVFRPFRVGDSIECGALAGTVKAVSLFQTELTNGDNIQVLAPNSLLWGAAVRNLSAHPTRRLAVTVPVPYPADVEAAVERIRGLVAADARVRPAPAPAVAIGRFTDTAAEIDVVLWCATAEVGALKADLMAALWRECLKPVV